MNESARSVDSNCNKFSTWWEILQGFIQDDLLRLLIPKFFPTVSPPKCLCSISKFLDISLCFSLPISKVLKLSFRCSNPLVFIRLIKCVLVTIFWSKHFLSWLPLLTTPGPSCSKPD